jgi:nitrite reductase/ring-hydroxylating ferredoxin subunit
LQKEKTYQWYKIAESLSDIVFASNQIAEITVAGKKICLVNQSHAVQACYARCPHAGGNFADGYIDALGNLVCPLHRYKFNTQTGKNVSGEGYFLKTYPVQIRDNGVYIGIEQNNFLNWLK